MSKDGWCCVCRMQMPQSGDLWGCYVDLETRRMDSWERAIPLFRYNKDTPFFEVS